MGAKKRILELDVLRALAFSFVVFQHTMHKDILFRICNIFFWLLFSIKVSEFKVPYSIFKFISKYSYAAYFIHYIAICTLIFKFYSFDNNSSILAVFLIGLSSILYAPVLIFFLSLLPFSEFITGGKSNFKHFIEIYFKELKYYKSSKALVENESPTN